jgi:hypothetical protein
MFNNIGVRMLERGLYQHAYLTFRASVVCMKRFINLSQDNILDHEDEVRFATKVHHDLQRARERLSTSDHLPRAELAVDSISYDGPYHHTSMMTALWRAKHSPTCIRINSFHTILDFRNDHELEPAIILYNFGVSHFCLSSRKTNEKTLPEWQCSFDLFEMSYEMVAGENTGFWDFRSICSESLPFALTRALLGAHSLRSMTNVLELTGNLHGAAKAKTALQKILMVVDELEETSESSVDSIAASAA